MGNNTSIDLYLWAVQFLGKKYCCVRSVDVAHYLNYSKPSVSAAVKKLVESGMLIMETDGNLVLTETGVQYMLDCRERCDFFHRVLLAAGLEPDTAEKEAFSLAQAVQPDTFAALKTYLADV